MIALAPLKVQSMLFPNLCDTVKKSHNTIKCHLSPQYHIGFDILEGMNILNSILIRLSSLTFRHHKLYDIFMSQILKDRSLLFRGDA